MTPTDVDVRADLCLDVDGTPVTITADGHDVVVRSPHPERVWREALVAAGWVDLGRGGGRRAVGQTADRLAGVGLTVTVTGPRGDVVVVGRRASSRVGALAAGSRHVAPGHVRAVGPLALAFVQARLRPSAADVRARLRVRLLHRR